MNKDPLKYNTIAITRLSSERRGTKLKRVYALPFASMEGVNALADGVPTGPLGLNISIDGKGMPRGRVVGSLWLGVFGKTTLCLHIIAEAQKARR